MWWRLLHHGNFYWEKGDDQTTPMWTTHLVFGSLLWKLNVIKFSSHEYRTFCTSCHLINASKMINTWFCINIVLEERCKFWRRNCYVRLIFYSRANITFKNQISILCKPVMWFSLFKKRICKNANRALFKNENFCTFRHRFGYWRGSSRPRGSCFLPQRLQR